MRAYFDTSALIPLVIAERGSARCLDLWAAAGLVVTSSLAYAEAHAALAQAARLGRITPQQHVHAVDSFQLRWAGLAHVAPSDELIATAARLSASHRLRGYDAVHCATALATASEDFVAVSGDRDLLRAWSDLGIPTVDVSR